MTNDQTPKRYQRHERFTWQMATWPKEQLAYEAERARQRDDMLGGIDFICGVDSLGANEFAGEVERLRANVKEAKRRALCGADPLNITGHTKGKAAKVRKHLAADPVEQIGHISRTVNAVNRLKGKNKLDVHQTHAAATYLDAFEVVHSGLGGSMDFERVRGGGGFSGPAEAVLIASERLREAKGIVGRQAIIVIESVVCHGRGIEETTRLRYGYSDGQATVSRDVNFIGRMLREALTELAKVWHPVKQRSDKVRGYSASPLDHVVGDAGVISMGSSPYVMR